MADVEWMPHVSTGGPRGRDYFRTPNDEWRPVWEEEEEMEMEM